MGGFERMLGVESLHHVSVAVTDLARAKRFYGGLLGLEEIERPAFDFPGAWYAIGDRQLHLIVHDGGRTLRGTREPDSHDGHFAIRVRSWRAALDRLQALDVPHVAKPRNATGWPQIFVTDPDGNVVELNAVDLD